MESMNIFKASEKRKSKLYAPHVTLSELDLRKRISTTTTTMAAAPVINEKIKQN